MASSAFHLPFSLLAVTFCCFDGFTLPDLLPKQSAGAAVTLASDRDARGASAQMGKIFRFGGLIEFALVLIEAIWHVSWLPIGGSHAAQIAACFGAAAIVSEMIELLPGGAAVKHFWPSKTVTSTSLESKQGVADSYFGPERRSGVDRRSCGRGGRRTVDLAVQSAVG